MIHYGSTLQERCQEKQGSARIALAGGCFWGTEAYLKRLPGVEDSFTAYANGSYLDPSYPEVCEGKGDHVEAVFIRYNPQKICLEQLLYYFFQSFDARQKDRQGADIGRQYRSGIYYFDAADLPAIQRAFEREEKRRGEKIATEVLPLENISIAETYHQDYLGKNPQGYCHVSFASLPSQDLDLSQPPQ